MERLLGITTAYHHAHLCLQTATTPPLSVSPTTIFCTSTVMVGSRNRAAFLLPILSLWSAFLFLDLAYNYRKIHMEGRSPGS